MFGELETIKLTRLVQPQDNVGFFRPIQETNKISFVALRLEHEVVMAQDGKETSWEDRRKHLCECVCAHGCVGVCLFGCVRVRGCMLVGV